MRRFLPACVLLPLLLAVAAPAGAWGWLGHRLVAALAWQQLQPEVRAEIETLLAGEAEASLPGIANWADQLRENDPDLGRRSARWHYVNIAEHDCAYDAARACPGGDCVVGAIREQAAILADRSRPREERLQALKFVVHFVGDVHQPLHAGYGHDKGGNTVQVRFDGDGSNLHRLWDSGLLHSADLDEAAWLQRLGEGPHYVPGKGDAADWARNSCRIALQPGFYPSQPVIDDGYVRTWRPVAERQLERGGAHLAALLNRTLGAR
jgi:hypothetical protein